MYLIFFIYSKERNGTFFHVGGHQGNLPLVCVSICSKEKSSNTVAAADISSTFFIVLDLERSEKDRHTRQTYLLQVLVQTT